MGRGHRLNLFSFVRQLSDIPLGGIIYTDIAKDGKMSGPNFELTGQCKGNDDSCHRVWWY